MSAGPERVRDGGKAHLRGRPGPFRKRVQSVRDDAGVGGRKMQRAEARDLRHEHGKAQARERIREGHELRVRASFGDEPGQKHEARQRLFVRRQIKVAQALPAVDRPIEDALARRLRPRLERGRRIARGHVFEKKPRLGGARGKEHGAQGNERRDDEQNRQPAQKHAARQQEFHDLSHRAIRARLSA